MLNLFKRKCYLCNRRYFRKQMRSYYDDAGNKINICENCVSYAERRALRRG